MIAPSFAQIYGNTVLNIPLPQTGKAGYCRECGGPMDKPGYREYGDTWVDEGIIAYSESKLVCAACQVIYRGSTTRRLLAPPPAHIMLVGLGYAIPAQDRLRRAHTEAGKGIKGFIYANSVTFLQFLQMLPGIPPPFGVVIGTGGGNDRHFIRSVPVNWTVNGTLQALLLPAYDYAAFRPKVLLESFDELSDSYSAVKQSSIKSMKQQLTELWMEELENIKTKRRLSLSEGSLLTLSWRYLRPIIEKK